MGASVIEAEPRSRRRKRLPNIVPAWEGGNAVRQFSRTPAAALPVVAADGRVERKFPTARAGAKRKTPAHSLAGSAAAAPPSHAGGERREEGGGEGEGDDEGESRNCRVAGGATGGALSGDRLDGLDGQHKGRKRRRVASKQVSDRATDFSAEMKLVERAKTQIAGMATAVVANPEASLKHLNELRKLAKSSNRTITTLVILTESQLYKDICPSYRIRSITEEEANVKVSKDVAALRNYEQGLLAAYTRFIRSIISLSKWSGGSAGVARAGKREAVRKNWTEAEKKMHKLRRAACTALCETARALLHFNLATDVASVVAGLTGDKDPAVRKEARDALGEVLGEAHKCAGTSLTARVQVAEQLAKSVVNGKALVQAETVAPLLHIRFAFFSKFTNSTDKREPKKAFNRKHRVKKSSAQAAKEAREAAEKERQERLDLERDMKEAHAEATAEELFNAKKSLLNSVCKACFNVVKAASESALAAAAATRSSGHVENPRPESRTRKPPPALALALEGVLLVATLLQGDLVDAILLALGPILEGDTLPLAIRFRSLAAAYAILSAHAAEQMVDADSFTRDARAMDMSLYAALGHLYGPSSPLNLDEVVTAEALRAVCAAHSGRRMPAVRLAAFARRLGVLTAACAPTHACAVGLLSATQLMLPSTLVECVFPASESGPPANDVDGQNGREFGGDGGLVQEYQIFAEDPDVSGAEHSAAWELAALSAHYHPSVRAIARQCCAGSCGDRRPAGAVDPPGTLEAHSSAKGGFNPAPVSTFKHHKHGSSSVRRKGAPSLDAFFALLGGECGQTDVEKDSVFPEAAFCSLWTASRGAHPE